MNSRADKVRQRILDYLEREASPRCTTQISDAVRTPREQLRPHLPGMYGRSSGVVPVDQAIMHSDIYPALCSLERRGQVGRLPRAGSRDPVWWHLVNMHPPADETGLPLPPEVEPVDLDALLLQWAKETTR